MFNIHLNEIPDEGKAFVVNRHTGELNSVLFDLIKDAQYSCEFFIRPLNTKNYELTGFIKTQSPEACSKCGDNFTFDIDVTFKELLIPGAHLPRNGQFAKPNHFTDLHDETHSTFEYFGNDLQMGEYLHEAVGLAIPFNPTPACDNQGNCTLCHKNIQNVHLEYKDDGFDEDKVSPFEVLKNMKNS
jgi:uncharacterized protein